MENINNKIKRRQLILLSIIIVGIILIAFLGYIYLQMQNDNHRKVTKKKEPPQLAGVINQTFDEKYTNNLLKENQSVAREIDRKYDALQSQVKKKDDEILKLKNQVADQDNKFKELVNNYNKRFDELERRKNGNSYNIDMNDNFANNQYNPNDPNNHDGYGELARPTDISTMIVNSDLIEEINDLPYIPSGSFAEAIIIEGADANASVTGNNNTDPIQFRLIGKVHMPNDEEYDLTGCFVTGEVYGDISSERGKVRTHSLSCKKNGEGKTIDTKIKGHVAFSGKNGIKGTPIMRNGKIVAWAGAAGLLDGLGKGAESAAGTTVGVGATADVAGADVMKSALGGGVSQAAKTLSDYYIKRAEQYHPIIEIGSGNLVTVMFQDGFQLEYYEDMIKNKNKNKNNDLLKNTSSPIIYNNYFDNNKASQRINNQDNYNTNNLNNNDSNINQAGENNSNNNQIEDLKNIYLDDFLKKDE